MPAQAPPDPRHSVRQRWRLLCQITSTLETPMAVLGLVWAALLVADLVHGLSAVLQSLSNLIWAIFIGDFCLRLLVAPSKGLFLRRNVLTLLSLALPAFRLLRLLRLLSVVRGVQLVRVLTSLNRGMRSLRHTLRRRRLGYVLATTLLVTVVGAAGMYAFEHTGPSDGFRTYGDALWWTAMLLTSIASEYWPRTPEGRVLCLALSLYGFGLFGYFTATLASLFLGGDARAAASDQSEA